MVNSNADTLGILFPDNYSSLVPDLVSGRLMASAPFTSRCHPMDFILSDMANCGIGNISLIVHRNYHSLMDRLDSGREWDLTHKSDGLNLAPPFAEKTVSIYSGRVEALASILDSLKEQKEEYVVMADTNLTVNFDFNALIQAHMDSRADITVAYKEEPLPSDLTRRQDVGKNPYYTLAIGNSHITKMYMSSKEPGVQSFSMSICIIDRELLINQINTAYVREQVFFEHDILAPQIGGLNVQAFRYNGYAARISNVKDYFDENMEVLDDVDVDMLFPAGSPIYTKIRDDSPSRYINGSKAVNVIATDGCTIEDEVEDSILFRGVKIRMGARIKNCVLMQDTMIETGASVEYAIADKNVTIIKGKDIRGTGMFLVYVVKYQVV